MIAVSQARAAATCGAPNRYSLADPAWEEVLDYCGREGLGFLPWFSLDAGRLTQARGPLLESADRYGATPARVALAWLL